jgi:predicted small metal-binding protein
MKILKCKELNLNRRCPFEWRGGSVDEVLEMAISHITNWHKPKNMPEVLSQALSAIHDEQELRGRSASAT